MALCPNAAYVSLPDDAVIRYISAESAGYWAEILLTNEHVSMVNIERVLRFFNGIFIKF